VSAYDNSLVELAMARAGKNLLSYQVLLWMIAASTLTVPTPDPAYNGDLAHFTPLLLERNRVHFLATFTRPDLIGPYRPRVALCIDLPGAQVIAMMPPNVGLVINPDNPVGCEVPPEGLAALRSELVWP
jgi:hypothetical protein